jgi:L-lactate permease
MTEDGAGDRRAPKRFQKLKFNPLRDVLPIVAVIVGVFLVVRAVAGLADGGDPLLIYVGSGLAVLGVAVFFINRWQRKRGLSDSTSNGPGVIASRPRRRRATTGPTGCP